MRLLPYIGLLCGLLLLTILLVWQGLTAVIDLLLGSGWVLLLLPLTFLPYFIPTTESWRMLFLKGHKPPFPTALLAIILGRSVNSLLPVATIGGEIVKARILILHGSSINDSTASVMVDKTAQVVAVIIWGLIGIGLLAWLSLHDELVVSALIGFAVLAICTVGFVLVQRAGIFSILAKLGAKLVKLESWEDIHADANAIDKIVLEVYRNRMRFFAACLLKASGLALQTLEVWLACYLLGFPVSLLEALMLKSLTSTLSDVAFLIPNGYGIQEGAYILLGGLLGMSADMALAVSLATRIREIFIDLPGLLYWQLFESRYWFKKRNLV